MKIKYVGDNPIGIIDFVTYGICNNGESLEKNKTYDVPNDVPDFLIEMIKRDADFEIVSKGKAKMPKKKEKEDE